MAKITIEIPDDLHPDSVKLLEQSIPAVAAKMVRSQVKRGVSNEWLTDDWETECRRQLSLHVEKGDPLDVIIYGMFCHYRGWSTSLEHTSESIANQNRSDVCMQFSKDIAVAEKLKLNAPTKLQVIEYYIRRFIMAYSLEHPFANMHQEQYRMAQMHLSVATSRLKGILSNCLDREVGYPKEIERIDRIKLFVGHLEYSRIVSLDFYNGENPSPLDHPWHPNLNKVQIQDLNATLSRMRDVTTRGWTTIHRASELKDVLALYSATLPEGRNNAYLAYLLLSHLQPTLDVIEAELNNIDQELTEDALNDIAVLTWFQQNLENDYVPNSLDYLKHLQAGASS